MNRTFALAGLAAAILASVPALAQEVPIEAKVGEIFARMNQSEGSSLWDEALALEGLGASAGPEIAKRLDMSKTSVKLAAAKALLTLDGAEAQRSRAIQALKDVIRGDASRDLRVRACDLLAVHGMRSEVSRLKKSVDAIHDPIVKIHLLKALRLKGRYGQASRHLKAFLNSDDFGVRCEAALALAEIGNIDAGKEVLSRLKEEPTDRGRRAKAYLELEDLNAKLEKFGGLESESELLGLRDKEIARLTQALARIAVLEQQLATARQEHD